MAVPRMDKKELREILDDPETAVIDVRRKPRERKIPGARIEDPDNVDTWMHKYVKEDKTVLYCA